MLSEEILLPFGLALSLGSYLILFKYLYSFLYVLWVAAAARWEGRRLIPVGAVALGLFGLVAMQLPLGRAYGLEEGSPLLPVVADSMVVAAGASPFDGWRVDQDNARPAWSLLLAALSAFDPSRLARLWPFVGFISFGMFCALTFTAAARLERTAAGVMLGFALLLSSGQLDFLAGELIYLPRIVLVEPHYGLSLPLVLLAGALLLEGGRGVVAGTLLLGGLAYLDTTFWMVTAGAVLLALAGRGVPNKIAPLTGVGAGVVLGLPAFSGVSPVETSLAATVLFPSPVPFLALVAGVALFREGKPAHRYAVLLLAGSGLAAAAGSPAGPVLLRYLVSLFAGYGFCSALSWWKRRASSPTTRPKRSRAAALLVLLPFTFFYWWQPRTMDRWFQPSLSPVSPRLENLAEWMIENTPEDAVVLVFENLGPWLPAFTGRRVVLARVGESFALPEVARARNVTHVVILRADLERLPHLREVVTSERDLVELHAVARWARVYAPRRSE